MAARRCFIAFTALALLFAASGPPVKAMEETAGAPARVEAVGQLAGREAFDAHEATAKEEPQALLAEVEMPVPIATQPAEETPTAASLGLTGIVANKWDLWAGDGTHLRGANIWQAVVIPELDGPDVKGPGPVGPPYIQTDFDRLAALGANYVNISHPGVFTVAGGAFP